jgi:hypothetical protein
MTGPNPFAPMAPQQAPPQQYAPAPQQPQYAPQQGYAPQFQGQYPPQQYAPAPQFAPPQFAPTPPPPPQPAPANGTLDDYFNQPAVAGGRWWFSPAASVVLGTTEIGVVARGLTNSDVRQGEFNGVLQTNRDGSPSLEMIVPFISQDGTEAQWQFNNRDRNSLNAAMGEAGCTGAPRKGDTIRATVTEVKKNTFGTMSKLKKIEFWKGDGWNESAPAPAPAPAEAPSTMAQGSVPVPPAPAAVVPASVIENVGHPAAAQAAVAASAPTPPAPAPGVQEDANAKLMSGLSPEQQAAFAAMLGGAK